MDKPEFVINQTTGRTLKQWSTAGISLEKIKKEISNCDHLDGLRHIYQKYPDYQKQLYPLIMDRKGLIEDSKNQIIDEKEVEQTKQDQNGNTN